MNVMINLRLAVARARSSSMHIRTPTDPGGEAVFLPLALRRAALALTLTMLFGCSAAKQVATAQNGYDFREARYEEACVVVTPPAECAPTVIELHAAEKHMHEAAKAVKLGGALPLQLAALKADAKKLKKRTVTK
jgi:hypothetical protein